MKKISTFVLAVVLLSGILFSAGASPQPETPETTEDPVLTVYAYDSFVSEWGPGPAVKEGFEAQYGITVELHSIGDSGQVLQRAILEKDDPQADVVIGIDNNMLSRALDEDIFMRYESPRLEQIDGDLHFDPSYRVLPYDYGYFAIIYDSQVIDTPPASLEELTDPRFEDQLILMDPRTSSPGLGFLLWTVSEYGDEFTDYWQRLKPSILTVTEGWDTGYGLFTNNEAPMVLSYTTSPAYHVEYEDTNTLLAAMFDSGHYQQVEGVGITKGAEHVEEAKLFVDYLLSQAAQEIIPLTNWMYPVLDEAELPESFAYAPKADRHLEIESGRIEDNLDTWIDAWVEVMSR